MSDDAKSKSETIGSGSAMADDTRTAIEKWDEAKLALGNAMSVGAHAAYGRYVIEVEDAGDALRAEVERLRSTLRGKTFTVEPCAECESLRAQLAEIQGDSTDDDINMDAINRET